MNTKSINIENHQIFITLSSIIVFSVTFYIYCIIGTVYNVVDREALENRSNDLALTIEDKQFKLLSAKNNITLSVAESMGFKETKESVYISSGNSNFAKADLEN